MKVNQVESWDNVDPKYWKTFIRTSHESRCSCGQPLYKHGQPLKESCPTMIQDCEGRWWKT